VNIIAFILFSVIYQEPNNGNSRKSSMCQNVQTCILKVNSTRIGIELPVDIVHFVRSSLPHATRYTSNMHRSIKEHTNT